MSLQSEDYVGTVSAIISLSDIDCTVQEKPPPLSFLLPRSTALLAIRSEVLSFFSTFTVLKADAAPFVWLTHRHEPVPWHYPIGAIKDSLHAATILSSGDSPFSTFSGDKRHHTSGLSLAALWPTLYTAPLELEARLTCVGTDRPIGVPCTNDEEALNRRVGAGDAVAREFLKQTLKGTYSAMYGTFKPLMDARSETVQDMLNFALCTATGEPFVWALRAHAERVAGLRRVAGDPPHLAVMLNAPFGTRPMHFGVFRSDLAANGGRTRFGDVLWRVLREPWGRWAHMGEEVAARVADALAPFFATRPDGAMGETNSTAPIIKSAQAAEEHHTHAEEVLGGHQVEMFIAAGKEGVRLSDGRRLRFVVQGLEPPLCTPVEYLLQRLPACDGRLYVTLAVA